MSQDNGWYKRGELPPVGVECEMLSKRTGVFCFGKVIAYNGLGACWFSGEGIVNCEDKSIFRPLKTDRDKFVERISNQWLIQNKNINNFFADQYDKGLRYIE